MNVKINGNYETINGQINLLQLVKLKNLNPAHIVIEYNKKVLKRDEWENIIINENDNIEIITFVGGG